MAVKQRKTKPTTITKAAIANSVRKETNTTLSGNQGSTQPGAPKSLSAAARATNVTELGQSRAMPCSKWKGDTNK